MSYPYGAPQSIHGGISPPNQQMMPPPPYFVNPMQNPFGVSHEATGMQGYNGPHHMGGPQTHTGGPQTQVPPKQQYYPIDEAEKKKEKKSKAEKDAQKKTDADLKDGKLSILTIFAYNTKCRPEEVRVQKNHYEPKAKGSVNKQQEDFILQQLQHASRSGSEVLWMNVDGRNEDVLKFILDKVMGESLADLPRESILMAKQRVVCSVLNNTLFLLTKIPELEKDYILKASNDPDEVVKGAKKILDRMQKATKQGTGFCSAKPSNVVDDDDDDDDDDNDTDEHKMINYERIGFVVNTSTGILITLQGGEEGDVWDGVRDELDPAWRGKLGLPTENMKNDTSNLRSQGVLILFWCLLKKALGACEDIDRSFQAVLDLLNSNADIAEKEDRRTVRELKHEMEAFKRRVVPLRDAFKQMVDADFPTSIIPHDVRPFFEELHHQALRIMDNIEGHLAASIELQNRYVFLDTQRDAKIQFIISMALAFFSPLSFIVGLYGMNFEGDPDTGTGGIPELTWKDGYSYVWYLMMAVILAIIVGFFCLGIIPIPGFIRRAMKPKRRSTGVKTARVSSKGTNASNGPKYQGMPTHTSVHSSIALNNNVKSRMV